MTSTEVQPIQNIRENLVVTAVQFLQNQKVRDSATTQKESFLRKKGLTDEEIKLAFQRAGPSPSDNQTQNLQQAIPSLPFTPNGNQQQVVVVRQTSLWSNWRYITKTVILVSGLSFGLYYLFDKYLGPVLWGSRDRLRSMEITIESMETSLIQTCKDLQETLKQIKDCLAAQQIEIKKLSENKNEILTASSQMLKLEADIASVKGLLLSRRQFPTVPVTTSPGIPSWQLSTQEPDDLQQKDSSGDPSPVSNGTSSPELVERIDERGGGSYE